MTFARSLILTLSLLAASPALAVKVLIVTDQVKAQKAREVANLFRTTEPFSKMRSLEFEVIQTTSRKLGCDARAMSKSEEAELQNFASSLSEDELLAISESEDRLSQLLTPTSEKDASGALPPSCQNKDGTVPTRLVSCDTPTARAYIQGVMKSQRASFALIVKNENRYGGSGGQYPVITTGSPASMAIHEFMHRLGFADEYGYYNSCEADLYCDQQRGDFISRSGYGALPGTSFNVALFNSKSSYRNDADARTSHGQKIPWLSSISSSTKLTTNSKLGTPEPSKTGIYRAIVCDKATKKLETWQSTSTPNIMRTLSTTAIPKPYWETIAKSLGTQL